MTSLTEAIPGLNVVAAPAPVSKPASWPKGATVLELRLPAGWPERPGVLAWCLRRDGAIVEQGLSEDASALADKARGARLMVWSPPAATLLTHASLPTRNRAKVLQALPYALEDHLLGDPDEQHFAFKSAGRNGFAVAVTRRAVVQGWLDALQAAGLRPTALAPASLALPYAADAWSVAYGDDAEVVWCRTGRERGFACAREDAQPPSLLQAALHEAQRHGDAPTTLIVVNPPAEFDAEAWRGALGLHIAAEHQGLWESQVCAPPEINLLQGEFAGAVQQHASYWQKLRPAAILLGLWLLGSIVGNVYEWQSLRYREADTRARMVALFRTSFPDAKVVQDPALQMQRKLDELKARGGQLGANDFLPLLSQAARALRGEDKAALQSVKYDNTGLLLSLTLPDFQSLENLKNTLTGEGLTVEVVSANSRAGNVAGRLRIHAE